MPGHTEIERLIRHQQRSAIGRMIATGGIPGFVMWCIATVAVIVFAAAIIYKGEYLSAGAVLVLPVVLLSLLRHKLVDWWPASRHALNTNAFLIVLSVALRSQVPALATPEADLARLFLCAAHVTAYFWILSSRRLVPSDR